VEEYERIPDPPGGRYELHKDGHRSQHS